MSNKSILIQSKSMLKENKKCSEMTALELVKEYVNLPYLPTEQEIIIAKIGVYNWNQLTRCSGNCIHYGMFTLIDKDEYNVGTNPALDNMFDEHVSPVVIIDNIGNKFKIKDNFWMALIDIHDGIIEKQSITHKKLLPYKIFIDKDKVTNNGVVVNKWISKLFNLVGKDILDRLKCHKYNANDTIPSYENLIQEYHKTIDKLKNNVVVTDQEEKETIIIPSAKTLRNRKKRQRYKLRQCEKKQKLNKEKEENNKKNNINKITCIICDNVINCSCEKEQGIKIKHNHVQ